MGETRERVMAFILEYKARNDGNSPSVLDICAGCGISSTSVVRFHLETLAKMGLIVLPGKWASRSIQVVGGTWKYNGKGTMDETTTITNAHLWRIVWKSRSGETGSGSVLMNYETAVFVRQMMQADFGEFLDYDIEPAVESVVAGIPLASLFPDRPAPDPTDGACCCLDYQGDNPNCPVHPALEQGAVIS